MCGIAGIFSKGELSREGFKRSLELVAHRGPDHAGLRFIGGAHGNADLRWEGGWSGGLGHRRLSILDLSSAGNQPFSDDSGRYWMVHNGEVYNYLEIKAELEGKGYSFQSGTDTEVILKAYIEWGEECLGKFNGMWAFAILDLKKRELFCSRDRYGVKPFYYFHEPSSFGFGSEIRQLLHGLTQRRANFSVVNRFLQHGLVNEGTETCFEGVRSLDPGSFLRVSFEEADLKIQQGYFYELGSFRNQKLSFQEWNQKLSELLKDSIRLRLRSDVDVGSCLSGGLDSSTIVTLMRELAPKAQIHAFTSCFREKEFDEFQYAKLVSSRNDLIHHQTFPSSQDLWEQDLERLIEIQEEPFGSASIYAQYKVMELAHKNGLKVLLDGQGADEALGGYHRYLSAFVSSSFRRFEIQNLLSLIKSSQRNLVENGKILGKGLAASLGLKAQKVTPMSYWKKPEVWQGYDKSDLKGLLGVDIKSTLTALLRYEDRNSMAFSIETRTPFLDWRLVEHIYAAPVGWLFQGGWTKGALRNVMRSRLPAEVLWRKDKMGFVTPQSLWLKEKRTELQRQIMESQFLEEFFAFKPSAKSDFVSQLLVNEGLVWRLMIADKWAKQWKV